jgi:hypothetical protein
MCFAEVAAKPALSLGYFHLATPRLGLETEANAGPSRFVEAAMRSGAALALAR